MRIKTVRILGESGDPLIINQDVYDPAIHKLYEGELVKAEVIKAAEVEEDETEEIENDVVTKHHGGGRWTVTVNDQAVHEGFLKKDEAQALAAEY